MNQNLKTVVTLGGTVDGSFSKIGSTFNESMGKATKTVKELEREQGKLTKQIRKSKLAGADVSLLTRQYQKLSKELDTATEKAEAFEKSSDLGGKLAGIGAAGATAVGGIWAATAATAGLMTVTNKQTAEMQGLAQSYDMSIERFKTWNGVAEQAGLNGENVGDLIEELTNKFGEFKALGEQSSVSDVFGALGIDQSMMDGMKAADQFEFIMKRLGKVADKQQAASLADMLFGGEGNKLVTYIRNTGSSLDELLDKQRQFNLLTQKGASGAKRYSTSFDNLTNVITSAWAEVSGVVGGEFADDIDSLGVSIGQFVRENKPQILSFFHDVITTGRNLTAGLWSIGSTINDVAQAMGGWKTIGTAVASLFAAKLLVGMVGMVQTGVSVVKTLGLMKASMAGLNAAMAANPIGMITAAIGLLIFAGVELYQNWDSVVAWFGKTFTWFKTEFPATFGFLKTLFDWSPLGLVINHWGPITGFFSQLWDGLTSVFRFGWNVVKTLFDWSPLGLVINHWEPITQFFSNLWSGITEMFTANLARIKSIWETVSGWASKLKFWGDDEAPKANITQSLTTQSQVNHTLNDSMEKATPSRTQTVLNQQVATNKGTTIHQQVGEIKVYAAPGQNAEDVGKAVQAQLSGYQSSALYDLPEAS